MRQEAIFLPFFAVMLLTLVVWVYMYVRRLSFLKGNRIVPADVDTPEKAANVIPGNVALASHNLGNLFELPVIFYAVCIYIFATASIDRVYLLAAWCFFGFRLLHSLIHCTSNVVVRRFTAYILSAIVLWFMVLRAAVGLTATF